MAKSTQRRKTNRGSRILHQKLLPTIPGPCHGPVKVPVRIHERTGTKYIPLYKIEQMYPRMVRLEVDGRTLEPQVGFRSSRRRRQQQQQDIRKQSNHTNKNTVTESKVNDKRARNTRGYSDASRDSSGDDSDDDVIWVHYQPKQVIHVVHDCSLLQEVLPTKQQQQQQHQQEQNIPFPSPHPVADAHCNLSDSLFQRLCSGVEKVVSKQGERLSQDLIKLLELACKEQRQRGQQESLEHLEHQQRQKYQEQQEQPQEQKDQQGQKQRKRPFRIDNDDDDDASGNSDGNDDRSNVSHNSRPNHRMEYSGKTLLLMRSRSNSNGSSDTSSNSSDSGSNSSDSGSNSSDSSSNGSSSNGSSSNGSSSNGSNSSGSSSSGRTGVSPSNGLIRDDSSTNSSECFSYSSSSSESGFLGSIVPPSAQKKRGRLHHDQDYKPADKNSAPPKSNNIDRHKHNSDDTQSLSNGGEAPNYQNYRIHFYVGSVPGSSDEFQQTKEEGSKRAGRKRGLSIDSTTKSQIKSTTASPSVMAAQPTQYTSNGPLTDGDQDQQPQCKKLKRFPRTTDIIKSQKTGAAIGKTVELMRPETATAGITKNSEELSARAPTIIVIEASPPSAQFTKSSYEGLTKFVERCGGMIEWVKDDANRDDGLKISITLTSSMEALSFYRLLIQSENKKLKERQSQQLRKWLNIALDWVWDQQDLEDLVNAITKASDIQALILDCRRSSTFSTPSPLSDFLSSAYTSKQDRDSVCSSFQRLIEHERLEELRLLSVPRFVRFQGEHQQQQQQQLHQKQQRYSSVNGGGKVEKLLNLKVLQVQFYFPDASHNWSKGHTDRILQVVKRAVQLEHLTLDCPSDLYHSCLKQLMSDRDEALRRKPYGITPSINVQFNYQNSPVLSVKVTHGGNSAAIRDKGIISYATATSATYTDTRIQEFTVNLVGAKPGKVGWLSLLSSSGLKMPFKSLTALRLRNLHDNTWVGVITKWMGSNNTYNTNGSYHRQNPQQQHQYSGVLVTAELSLQELEIDCQSLNYERFQELCGSLLSRTKLTLRSLKLTDLNLPPGENDKRKGSPVAPLEKEEGELSPDEVVPTKHTIYNGNSSVNAWECLFKSLDFSKLLKLQIERTNMGNKEATLLVKYLEASVKIVSGPALTSPATKAISHRLQKPSRSKLGLSGLSLLNTQITARGMKELILVAEKNQWDFKLEM
ncbi:hypothetical protein BX616_009149 [Lobosporangium transversale]|nr:hypothetical protein BX616_009149 [Lobosporangium transversale]